MHQHDTTRLCYVRPTLSIPLVLAACVAASADPPAELSSQTRSYLAAVNDDTGLDRSPALDSLLGSIGSLGDAEADALPVDLVVIDAAPDLVRGQLFAIDGTFVRCDPAPAGLEGTHAWFVRTLSDDRPRVLIVIGPQENDADSWQVGDHFEIKARFYKRLVLPTPGGDEPFLTFVGQKPTVAGQSMLTQSAGPAAWWERLLGVFVGVCILGAAFIVLRLVLRYSRRTSGTSGTRVIKAPTDTQVEYDDADLPPDPPDALEVLHSRTHVPDRDP